MAISITKLRSPRYPIIGLREAIDKVRDVYEKDGRNKVEKNIIAEHMGYKSLNGKSLGIISAVSKYGLLEGSREAMWVTTRAVEILEREKDDPERAQALREAASQPEPFKDIEANFSGKASDAAIRSFLITKRQYLGDSAERLVRSFRETKQLLEEEAKPQSDIAEVGSADIESFTPSASMRAVEGEYADSAQNPRFASIKNNYRREVVALDEGDVSIEFPATLSVESVGELRDYLELFIRKAQRRANLGKAEEFQIRESGT